MILLLYYYYDRVPEVQTRLHYDNTLSYQSSLNCRVTFSGAPSPADSKKTRLHQARFFLVFVSLLSAPVILFNFSACSA